MSIAQQLCDEIVEPSMAQESAWISLSGINRNSSTGTQSDASANTSRKVRKSVIIDKRHCINKSGTHGYMRKQSGTVVNQLKTKDVVIKKYEDAAVNTLFTGPLRCDTDCITIVRKKDKNLKNSCKCADEKYKPQKSVKLIQTFKEYNRISRDKACDNIIDTTNCGTQFTDAVSKPVSCMTCSSIPKSCLNTRFYDKPESLEKMRCNLNTNSSRRHNDGAFIGPVAKRWAISRYPSRGPDF